MYLSALLHIGNAVNKKNGGKVCKDKAENYVSSSFFLPPPFSSLSLGGREV